MDDQLPERKYGREVTWPSLHFWDHLPNFRTAEWIKQEIHLKIPANGETTWRNRWQNMALAEIWTLSAFYLKLFCWFLHCDASYSALDFASVAASVKLWKCALRFLFSFKNIPVYLFVLFYLLLFVFTFYMLHERTFWCCRLGIRNGSRHLCIEPNC